MRLKTATITLTIFSLLLLVCWPCFVGAPASLKHAPRQAQAAFVERSGIYIIVLLLSWFGTLVLSWILLRRTRDEYREQAAENLKNLLEGTLQDHERKHR